MAGWKDKLAELGLALPPVAAPVAAYVPAVRTGSMVYTSGQLPIADGELRYRGKVGADVSVEDAKAAAALCALNCLAAVHDLVGLDSVVRVVKVTGFVASAPGFTDQPIVDQRRLRTSRQRPRRRRGARPLGGRGGRVAEGHAGRGGTRRRGALR